MLQLFLQMLTPFSMHVIFTSFIVCSPLVFVLYCLAPLDVVFKLNRQENCLAVISMISIHFGDNTHIIALYALHAMFVQLANNHV